MIILNPNKNNFSDELKGLYDSSPFEWQCEFCHEIHQETEKRNFIRRQNKCSCQKRYKKCIEMNTSLKTVNYEFLFNEPNSYTLRTTGTIDATCFPILVKCLNCGKISYEYYYNIKKEHKKCNCNSKKTFTRGLTTSEFIAKWSPLNQINFTLLDNEYTNRNSVYHIKCNNCGKEDERWGISLIDGPIQCKYCSYISLGEAIIATQLDILNIDYIREYKVEINNHLHKFDFFLPKHNMLIEYNGQQHYQIIEHFGGEEKFKERQERDQEKQEYCQKNNIKLVIFRYDEKEKDIRNQLNIMFNDYPEREYIISD